jgi:hypothetical protein
MIRYFQSLYYCWKKEGKTKWKYFT